MRHEYDPRDQWRVDWNSVATIAYIALAFLTLAFLIVFGAWLFTVLFVLVGSPE